MILGQQCKPHIFVFNVTNETLQDVRGVEVSEHIYPSISNNRVKMELPTDKRSPSNHTSVVVTY